MKPDRSPMKRPHGLPALWLAAVALLALAGLLRPTAVHAATINVAAGEVAVSVNGLCSLREAIINANADAATHADCTAGSGTDTITLPAAATFTLTDSHASYNGNTGLPQVTSAIIIDGNGSTIDRDSATGFRLLAVSAAGNLTLNDLSLTDGSMTSDVGGGAIYNSGGTVTLNGVTLTGNSGSGSQGGGAIHANGGTTTTNNSTFTSNTAASSGGGGGIYANNGATVNVTNSTFTTNQAAGNLGGAIGTGYSGVNAITVTGSTLNSNSANNGGAIGIGAGTVTVTNSTISGNTATDGGGGISGGNGTVTLNNVTITGNTANNQGGGVYSFATVNYNRSIVSGNSATNSGREILNWSTDNANNYNVFGHSAMTTAQAFGGSFTPGANDVNATSDGTQPTALAAILNTTLANNGGPTQTHALVAGSPAVDRAPSAACTAAPINGVDQRGYPRNVDGNAAAGANECDAGAYEYLSSPPPTTGDIVIVKEATPADDTPFDFTEDIPGAGNGFTLTDPADNTETFDDVAPGVYTIIETGEAGWTLDDIACVDPSNNTTEDESGGTAVINLSAGETVTCTFNNSRDTGTVIIQKQAFPEDDTEFDFMEDFPGTSGSFTLQDPSDNSTMFSDVPTGSYTVTETVETGWTLDLITCNDDGTTTDTGAGTAVIDLDKDETITCTFTNSRDTGTVTIVKDATPADDTGFDFTENLPGAGSGFTLQDPSDNTITFNVVPTGSYTVTESVTPGWTLDSIVCVDPDNGSSDAGTTATIDLDKGETVTCTFSNSQVPPAVAGIYVSTVAAGVTDDALAYGPHDVLSYDGTAWSKWFDGSAAGLVPSGRAIHNVNSAWIPDTGGDDVVLSFVQNARVVPGVPGKVNGMDLVWWDGSSFSLWFDGEDVGLTNFTQEKIDALHVLDGSMAPPALATAAGGSCDAYLLISTQGDGQVPNYSGGSIKFDGTDVLGFCLTQPGATTMGKWTRVLNGKAEGMPGQALTSLSASDDGETLYLTTRSAFNVDSASGGHSMVYRYDFDTGEFSGPFFSAPANGLHDQVDGLHVDGDLP